ncbi:QsdR family transcriptional regulator [Solwaraspora sp. WMMD1047]|uniref:QsdR family transcriptional regulator n=1 Tax=Solwaraspora sp. WMMD1047 TaxID=3016102 RepID=UPI00241637AA|nr:QsdR family transcriptional regulator [Solwaraspora sp. WMMD1047]MDG4832936.1 QsdR family transcriptional regulator [Solwaraspora sp. WMMD1047]
MGSARVRTARTDPAAPRRVIDHPAVVRGAIDYFLAHATIDMDDLASTLAVSRATLYRVEGSRDRLLGEVFWYMADYLLAAARAARRQDGVAGIVEVTRRFAEAVEQATAFRAFLAQEPEVAARVLFAVPGRVHRRAVRAQAHIFREVGGADTSWLPGDPNRLAYLYVRIVESAIYAELLSGQPPDLELAERALRALLTSPETDPPPT